MFFGLLFVNGFVWDVYVTRSLLAVFLFGYQVFNIILYDFQRFRGVSNRLNQFSMFVFFIHFSLPLVVNIKIFGGDWTFQYKYCMKAILRLNGRSLYVTSTDDYGTLANKTVFHEPLHDIFEFAQIWKCVYKIEFMSYSKDSVVMNVHAFAFKTYIYFTVTSKKVNCGWLRSFIVFIYLWFFVYCFLCLSTLQHSSFGRRFFLSKHAITAG